MLTDRHNIYTWFLYIVIYMWAPTSAADTCTVSADIKTIPAVRLEEIAAGLDNPVHLAHADNDNGWLYVVEQSGYLRILKNGKISPRPFLDIHDEVVDGGEKGLLSIAFHPRYSENGFFYVDYTRKEGLLGSLTTIISRFKRSTEDRADPDSEQVLLKIKQPFANHNGGQLAFGPDGYLYIGMGDGGLANDPFGHGQDTTTLLGALLRIDVDHASGSLRYAIPGDNPYIGKQDYRNEIWAYGLRNPWRFSFDRKSGALYLADVGQDQVEEVDVIVKGGNYGWNIMEGNRCAAVDRKLCDRDIYKPPIYTYQHPEGFSITGGFVYRGESIPGLCGVYLFADYVNKQLWGLRYDGTNVTVHKKLLDTGFNISSFGEDQSLEVYLLAHQAGKILKIIPVDSDDGDE